MAADNNDHFGCLVLLFIIFSFTLYSITKITIHYLLVTKLPRVMSMMMMMMMMMVVVVEVQGS